jgi:RNA polymerase sigma factor (sigma-70 family)
MLDASTRLERDRFVLAALPIVLRVARRFVAKSDDRYEDLVQEAMVRVLHEHDRDPTLCVEAVAHWSRGAMIEFLWGSPRRRLQKARRAVRFPSERIDAEVNRGDGGQMTLESVLDSGAPTAEAIVSAREQLACVWRAAEHHWARKRSQRIVEFKADGWRDSEIARQMGVSRERVRQMRCEVLDRARRLVG